MRKLNAKPLTADAFRKYGTYSRMINPDPWNSIGILSMSISEAEFRAHL